MSTKLKISWHNKERCYSFYYDGRSSFCLTQEELDRFEGMRGATCAFMDLARVVIVSTDAFRVIRLPDYLMLGYEDKEKTIEAEAFGFKCDVRRLLKVIRIRIEKGAFTRKSYFMENEGEFEVEVERFHWKERDMTLRGVMQIANSGEEPYHREQLHRSLAAFGKSLAKDNWKRLMAQCSRVLNDGGKLFGGGEEEINFRWLGMYGGIILRDSDYSTHT